MSPSFFPRSLYPPGQIPDGHTALQRELSCSGGEEGGWRWEPHPQDTRSPETPPSFGGARVGSAAAETPGSGDGGLRQRGTGRPGAGGRSLGHSLPSARSPRTAPPGDLILLRPQGRDTSLGPQRRQGQQSFVFFFFFLMFILN